MKRFICVCLISILIGFAFINQNENNSFFESLNGYHMFFCEEVSNDIIDTVNVIPNGQGYIVKGSIDQRNEVLPFLTGVKGECVRLLKAEYKLENLTKILNFKKIKISSVNSNTKSYYGYSDVFNSCIYIENKKCNVQIAEDQNNITIGFPIILGGF